MLVPNLALISLGLVSFSGVAVCFNLDPETECRHFEKKVQNGVKDQTSIILSKLTETSQK